MLVRRSGPREPHRLSRFAALVMTGGGSMATVACYLAEWYAPDVTSQPLEVTTARLRRCTVDTSSPIALTMAVAVPADDMILALFVADSAHAVAEVCSRAGLPAQRLTPAVQAL